MSKQIILSTDPGIDDALAIILLIRLNVLHAIWTTMGNNTIENCTKNAMKILQMLGKKEIPIIKGAAQPLLRKADFSAEVHGEDGLGNTHLPVPNTSAFLWKNIDYIISSIEKNPPKVSLVSIGPLTNLAILLQKAPSIVNSVKETIIMGGAVSVPGNVTPYAEFNIFCDPEAAKIVLNSGLPLTLVGLDVTHQVILTFEQMEAISAEKTVLSDFIIKIAHYYAKFHEGINGCYLHDPLAAAIVIDPKIISTKKMHVDVIIGDPKEAGQTFISENIQTPTISVAVSVNVKKFFDLFLRTLIINK
ncbi:MAG TPA: nucleoside hydrolase [Candidatus Deferrimicrobium sp.]|nr:nucleoside hydrolase [Candidatus Deferrimicrobium sp.]